MWALLGVLLLGPLSTLGAQEVRVAAGRAATSHELLGSPTLLEVGLGTGSASGLGWRIAFQHGRDDFTSTGSTCVGLVPPGASCGPELRSERATVRSWLLAMPLTESFGWGDLRLVPGIRRLTMESLQEGRESGRVRTAEKTAYGLQGGVELRVRPVDGVPIFLHLGAHAATHPWFEEETVADGYTPFEDTVEMSWLELGASLLLGAGPGRD